ncbi:hypothetical protein FKW77_009932 [Venturia effusa]|uniref:Uncharacterized protein n=1 Tax=Venturia effusa TaxID=50376 RepID=A0A517L4C7_9PEZI|nr:hypothetical protein FKW77_009932 [Venturia effusa]
MNPYLETVLDFIYYFLYALLTALGWIAYPLKPIWYLLYVVALPFLYIGQFFASAVAYPAHPLHLSLDSRNSRPFDRSNPLPDENPPNNPPQPLSLHQRHSLKPTHQTRKEKPFPIPRLQKGKIKGPEEPPPNRPQPASPDRSEPRRILGFGTHASESDESEYVTYDDASADEWDWQG